MHFTASNAIHAKSIPLLVTPMVHGLKANKCANDPNPEVLKPLALLLSPQQLGIGRIEALK